MIYIVHFWVAAMSILKITNLKMLKIFQQRVHTSTCHHILFYSKHFNLSTETFRDFLLRPLNCYSYFAPVHSYIFTHVRYLLLKHTHLNSNWRIHTHSHSATHTRSHITHSNHEPTPHTHPYSSTYDIHSTQSITPHDH